MPNLLAAFVRGRAAISLRGCFLQETYSLHLMARGGKIVAIIGRLIALPPPPPPTLPRPQDQEGAAKRSLGDCRPRLRPCYWSGAQRTVDKKEKGRGSTAGGGRIIGSGWMATGAPYGETAIRYIRPGRQTRDAARPEGLAAARRVTGAASGTARLLARRLACLACRETAFPQNPQIGFILPFTFTIILFFYFSQDLTSHKLTGHALW